MRNCPRCGNKMSVLDDGYCGVCRGCTMQPLESTKAKRDDGGSAFPIIRSSSGYPANINTKVLSEVESVGGMSLRDYFAGKALAPLLTSREQFNDDMRRNASTTRITHEDVAKDAYEIADAMLQERQKGQK